MLEHKALTHAVSALLAAQSQIAPVRPLGSVYTVDADYSHEAFMWDRYQTAIDEAREVLARLPKAKPLAFAVDCPNESPSACATVPSGWKIERVGEKGALVINGPAGGVVLNQPGGQGRPIPEDVLHALASALITAPVAEGTTSSVSPTWRCFHCDETFDTTEGAMAHFGRTEIQSPACRIDVAEYRAMERRMLAYNEEDAEIHRQMARLVGDHALALVREEERGYAKGLEDAKKHPAELGLVAAQPATDEELLDAARTAGIFGMEDRKLGPLRRFAEIVASRAVADRGASAGKA